MTKKRSTPKNKIDSQPKQHRSSASAVESDAELRERAFLISDLVEIKSLILIECAASRSPDLFEEGKRSAELAVSKVTHALCEEEHELQVQIEFGLTLTPVDSSDQKLEIKAAFAINYSLKSLDEFGERDYQAFAELNGVHNAWPFWREFVLNLTSRMGIRPLVIPVHRAG